MTYWRIDAGADTIDAWLSMFTYMTDGTLDITTIVNEAINLPACANDRVEQYTYTITSANLTAGKLFEGQLAMSEAGKEIHVASIVLRYHVKSI